jgi:hypothetical protein
MAMVRCGATQENITGRASDSADHEGGIFRRKNTTLGLKPDALAISF